MVRDHQYGGFNLAQCPSVHLHIFLLTVRNHNHTSTYLPRFYPELKNQQAVGLSCGFSFRRSIEGFYNLRMKLSYLNLIEYPTTNEWLLWYSVQEGQFLKGLNIYLPYAFIRKCNKKAPSWYCYACGDYCGCCSHRPWSGGDISFSWSKKGERQLLRRRPRHRRKYPLNHHKRPNKQMSLQNIRKN